METDARELQRSGAMHLALGVLAEWAEGGIVLTHAQTKRALATMHRALYARGVPPDPFAELRDELSAELSRLSLAAGATEGGPPDRERALVLAGAIRALEFDLEVNVPLGISRHAWAWARTAYAEVPDRVVPP